MARTTLYTDHAGLLPWVFSLMVIVNFWSAYEAFAGGRGFLGLGAPIGGVAYILIGGLFIFMLVKRLRDMRQAKREGRDPAIVRFVRRGR